MHTRRKEEYQSARKAADVLTYSPTRLYRAIISYKKHHFGSVNAVWSEVTTSGTPKKDDRLGYRSGVILSSQRLHVNCTSIVRWPSHVRMSSQRSISSVCISKIVDGDSKERGEHEAERPWESGTSEPKQSFRLLEMSSELMDVRISKSSPSNQHENTYDTRGTCRPRPCSTDLAVILSNIFKSFGCRREDKIELAERQCEMILRLGQESSAVLTWSERNIVFQQQLSGKRS